MHKFFNERAVKTNHRWLKAGLIEIYPEIASGARFSQLIAGLQIAERIRLRKCPRFRHFTVSEPSHVHIVVHFQMSHTHQRNAERLRATQIGQI